MADERLFTSRRMAIVNAIVESLKVIKGSFPYQTDLGSQVHNKLKFWDEVNNFPSVFVTAGAETRTYQGGGHKDRYLTVTVRGYVEHEDAVMELEGLVEDLETVIEENGRLAYKDRLGATQYTQQITIISIQTDEGVLEPLGACEIICEVRY